MFGKSKKLFTAWALMAALGACSNVATTMTPPLDTVSAIESVKATPEVTPSLISVKSSQTPAWHVEDVRVTVPDSLTVSEANLFMPQADIVWREDPYGDRRAQVGAIVDLAATQATLDLKGGAGVYLDIEVKRFHALSQKARATVGGQHNIVMEVCIRDTETNEMLVEPFPVHIRLKEFGGQKAIDAEMRGETQKVRISREITSVMRKYLGL